MQKNSLIKGTLQKLCVVLWEKMSNHALLLLVIYCIASIPCTGSSHSHEEDYTADPAANMFTGPGSGFVYHRGHVASFGRHKAGHQPYPQSHVDKKPMGENQHRYASKTAGTRRIGSMTLMESASCQEGHLCQYIVHVDSSSGSGHDGMRGMLVKAAGGRFVKYIQVMYWHVFCMHRQSRRNQEETIAALPLVHLTLSIGGTKLSPTPPFFVRVEHMHWAESRCFLTCTRDVKLIRMSGCVCVCVCMRERARACVRVCVYSGSIDDK